NMILKFFAILFLFLIFLTFSFSCKSTTKPEDDNKPDTTSHEFIWRIDTIGWRSTDLFDVSIINENNIWVSGYITEEGTDIIYSAAHWTGAAWKLERFRVDLPYKSFIDNATGIHAISDDDIWIASGSIFHWDGYLARISYLSDISLKHIWYNNDHDIYAVGNKGLILHYDGKSWHKLESGTTTYSNDVFGSVDPKTGKKTVLAVVSYEFTVRDTKVLSLHDDGTVVDTLTWDWGNDYRFLMGVWFEPGSPIYVAGSGIVVWRDSLWQVVEEMPRYSMYGIRGTSWNNIFAVGVYGMVGHYNGATWKTYPELSFDGILSKVDVEKDLMVTVGIVTTSLGNQGIIITGKRKK
ncbi:MAG: hypothetical protein GXO77_08825, partial [Calditrichaeota bacterium]|nr:hypothetical protein [Calditrichota bacterium]